jgi:serine protease Do
MTSRKILAGLVVVAAGVVAGAGILFAQKEDGGPRDEMQAMIEEANYPWLGVALKDVTPEQARELKLDGEYGAMVEKVEPDSPAAKAGLQAGDVIVEFAGEKVRSVAELRRLVRETPPGRTVEVRVRRNGENKMLSATLEARQGSLGPLMSRLRNRVWPEVNMPAYDFAFNFGGPRLGISADRLTPQLAEYFGVKQGKGVLVLEVAPGSAADKAGLKAGDCIVQVDSTPVESVMDLRRALALKPGASREITLTIVRDHQQQTVKAQIEARPPAGRHPVAESGAVT